MSRENKILEIKDLKISFNRYTHGVEQRELEVVHSLELDLYEGEILAIVGASGSGKSIMAHGILGILPQNAKMEGEVKLFGKRLTPELQKKYRGNQMVLIPQSVDYLDPLMKIGKQIKGTDVSHKRMQEIMSKYGLAKEVENLYPFQLSGGMARRVLISTAVSKTPKLIIADEPTPGLDLAMAKETLNHFRELANEGAGVLLITHDIDLALEVADRIAVFYGGTTVEVSAAKEFKEELEQSGKGKRKVVKEKEEKTTYNGLRHPYSKAFCKALPQGDFDPIKGHPPGADNQIKGCVFANRCPIKTNQCNEEGTKMRELRGGKVRCINAT